MARKKAHFESTKKQNGQPVKIDRLLDVIYKLFRCYCFIKVNVPALTEVVKHILEGNYFI